MGNDTSARMHIRQIAINQELEGIFIFPNGRKKIPLLVR